MPVDLFRADPSPVLFTPGDWITPGISFTSRGLPTTKTMEIPPRNPPALFPNSIRPTSICTRLSSRAGWETDTSWNPATLSTCCTIQGLRLQTRNPSPLWWREPPIREESTDRPNTIPRDSSWLWLQCNRTTLTSRPVFPWTMRGRPIRYRIR